MKLHWSPRSPFVRKVMVVAHDIGVAGLIAETSIGLVVAVALGVVWLRERRRRARGVRPPATMLDD